MSPKRLPPGALIAAALAIAGHVDAGQGVAIDAATIRIPKPLAPARRYDVRPLFVRNPGSEPGEYRMSVEFLERRGAEAADVRWIRVDEEAFALAPGAYRKVPIELVLPADAAPGNYDALLVASLMPRDGASVGAGTATRLSFSVERKPTDDETKRSGLLRALAAVLGALRGP